ncbi:MAG TPA: hypothetical protein DEB39_06505 [Planctomycetaceae bacterium]|nr:hypothetical protein [Planctomycetaceae bacterium]
MDKMVRVLVSYSRIFPSYFDVTEQVWYKTLGITMRFRIPTRFFPLFFLLFAVSAQGQPDTDLETLRRHVEVLTSEECAGRLAGSEGGRYAGDYLIAELRKMGIEPVVREFDWQPVWAITQIQSPGGIPKPVEFSVQPPVYSSGKQAPESSASGNFKGLQYKKYPYRNIHCVFKGNDAELSGETVILSAHYDHVGRESGGQHRIFPGANDNASGVATVLLVAKYLAALKTPPSRTIVLAFWDGEELGLCGSTYYTRAPLGPLKQTVFGLTLDMLGTLKNETLYVVGWRSGRGMRQFLSRCNSQCDGPCGGQCNPCTATDEHEPLNLDFVYPMWINSDHYPLYMKRIPSLLFFTGFDGPYHHPDDTQDRLSYEGMEKIAQFVQNAILHAANEPASQLPTYRTAEQLSLLTGLDDLQGATGTKKTPGMRNPRELKLRKSSAETDVLILRDVPEHSVLWRSGLRPNDRIYRIDGKAVDLEAIDDLGKRGTEDFFEEPHVLEVETDGKIRLVQTGPNGV